MKEEVIHIDVREAIGQKMPRYSKFIPGFLYRRIARLIRQDDLNRILDENRGKTGHDFAEGALRTLGIRLKVVGMENLPASGRYVFVSNHPLGGLDGIALISLLGKHYEGKVQCLVNDVLMAVKPLENVFLPVNKYGGQSREAMRRIDEAYAGDGQIITFPAGLCSRRNDQGEVRDLDWKKSFVVKSVETQRDIVPIYFNGLNSRFFYKFARFRKRLGIKFNIELILLPGELVKGRGTTFTINIGKPIPYSVFDKSRTAQEWADYVKQTVYGFA